MLQCVKQPCADDPGGCHEGKGSAPMIKRRSLLAGALSGTAALTIPHVSSAADRRVLRFVPNSDLTLLDPIWTAAFVTRMHGLMVFDTLYGQDNSFAVRPQMVAGHRVEEDGKRWQLTLRDGLRFHDGEPVLARDVVASLRRWGRVDAFGQTLLARTDELSAVSDQTVQFRLSSPFSLLPDALGKSTAFLPVIMPARLADSANGKALSEVVGSGPFRYVANEREDGVRTVYARFEDYVARPEGPTEFTSGPKIVHLDRVEWLNIPDDSTAAGALRTGQIDWLERPLIDLLPTLTQDRGITIDTIDRAGYMVIIRFNQLHPPFDRPEVRRAMLGAVDEAEIVSAVAGADTSLWQSGVGVFCPESPMANDAGMAVLNSARDYAGTRQKLAAAGYKGEKIVFLISSNNAAGHAISTVVADQFQRAGLNIEISETDFGTWLQRRNNRDTPEHGGWNMTSTFLPGTDLWDPAVHLAIRGNGLQAWSGWPTSPQLEHLRDQWFDAPDEDTRRGIARNIQLQVWQDVPYIPGGRWRHPTAYRTGITGVLRGPPLFYNVKLPT
jgi:peptide/nickel transport system substrate-binding protein